MTKEAQDNIYSSYYAAGVEHALQKTAGMSLDQFRRILSGGSQELAPLLKALGERQGGQAGTVFGGMAGAGGGAIAGHELAGLMSESPALAAALGIGGGIGGGLGLGALGNMAGRGLGGAAGEYAGLVQGMGHNRAINNWLADPLSRVPGIRG